MLYAGITPARLTCPPLPASAPDMQAGAASGLNADGLQEMGITAARLPRSLNPDAGLACMSEAGTGVGDHIRRAEVLPTYSMWVSPQRA